jgi:hypothetical protein
MTRWFTRPRRAVLYGVSIALMYVGLLGFWAVDLHDSITSRTASASELGVVPWITVTHDGVLGWSFQLQAVGLVWLTVVALAGAALSFGLWREAVFKYRLVGQCDLCGYILAGGIGRCPECNEITAAQTPRLSWKVDPRKELAFLWYSMLGLGLLGLAFCIENFLRILQEGISLQTPGATVRLPSLAGWVLKGVILWGVITFLLVNLVPLRRSQSSKA